MWPRIAKDVVACRSPAHPAHARSPTGIIRGSRQALTAPTLAFAPFWKKLYEVGADVVLVGHDHDYERFAPQTATGTRDLRRGIRQFVVGTGGKGFRPFETIAPNSVRRSATTLGVLRMTLRPRGYSWQFVPVGGSFTDGGSAACH